MLRYIPLALLLAGSGVFAAQIESETTENGAKVRWSVLYIDSSGAIRIDEGSWIASVSSSAEGSVQSASVQFMKSDVQDTIIYNPRDAEVLMLEGDICRVFSADSPPPPGMEFMSSPEMKAHQQQMSGAVADAVKQMEASGASEAQINAMKEMFGGMGVPGMPEPQQPSYSFELIDSNAAVGDYRGREYSIRDQNGMELYRVVMVAADDVPGGRGARNGMDGMMGLFRDYMQGAGLPGGYGDALMEVMQDDEFVDDYPASIFDVQENSLTAISAASAQSGDVEFDPQCERRGMLEP